MYLLPPRIKSKSRAISPAAGHALSKCGSKHGSSHTCITLTYMRSIGSNITKYHTKQCQGELLHAELQLSCSHENHAAKTATGSDERLTRSEVECLQDSCKDNLVWLASCAVCVYVHRQGLCNTNGIGYLHQATLGQPRCYNRLGCLTCNVGTCNQTAQDQ